MGLRACMVSFMLLISGIRLHYLVTMTHPQILSFFPNDLTPHELTCSKVRAFLFLTVKSLILNNYQNDFILHWHLLILRF